MALNDRQEFHRYKHYYLRFRSLSAQPLAQASLALAASLLTVALLGVFAIRPTLATIARLTKEIQDKEKIDKQLANKITALRKADISYQQVASQIPLVETALPTKPEFSRLEQELEFLAWQHQILLASGGFSGFVATGTKPEEEEKEEKKAEAPPADSIRFNLTIGGSYGQIKDFIKDLENLDRVIFLESVHFTKETEIEGAQVQATLVGQAFYKTSKDLGKTK